MYEYNHTNSIYHVLSTFKLFLENNAQLRSFTVLVFFLFFRLVLIFCVSSTLPNDSKNSISHGLYYDFIDKIKFENQETTIVNFVNISGILDDFNYLQFAEIEIVKVCKLNAPLSSASEPSDLRYNLETICHNFKSFAKSTETILKTREQSLLNFLGVSLGTQTRSRRAILPFVGTVNKFLFGTAEDSDVQNLESEISKTKSSINQMHSLQQKQTIILESFASLSNETLSNINNIRNDINDRLNIVGKNFNKIGAQIDKQAILYDLKLLIENFKLLVGKFTDDLELIIDAIIAAKSGIIHPIILNPIVLLNELKNNKLDFNLKYPFGLTQENISKIVSISKLTVFFRNSVLIYILNIPIVMTTNFKLYEVIPIPQHVNSSTFIFIKPENRFLCMNEDQNAFIPLSESQVNSCKSTTSFRICKQSNIVTYKSNANICEIRIFSDYVNDISSCKYSYFKLNSEIWHKLHKRNTFIFCVPEKQKIKLNCENFSNISEIENVGILTLNDSCSVQTRNVILIAEKSTKTQIVNLNLENFQFPIPISTYNVSINLTKINQLGSFYTANTLHKLYSIENSIDDLKIETADDNGDKLNTWVDLLPNFSHYLSVGVNIILIILIVLIVRHKLARNRPNTDIAGTSIQLNVMGDTPKDVNRPALSVPDKTIRII